MLLALGPFRPLALNQLVTFPRFLEEMVLGAGTVIALAVMGVRLSIPGTVNHLLPVGLLAIFWLGTCVIGFFQPVMDTGMSGKREHCLIEVFLYGFPIMALMLMYLRRGYVTQGPMAGFTTGLASGLVPGLLMQLACMYQAEHALVFHFAPALLLGLAGAAAGLALTRKEIVAE
jgi:hypothetical protein